jgi:transposase
MSLPISRKEKEQLVIKLAQEGKATREIAKQVHISLRDIGIIIRRETGNDCIIEIEKQKQEAEEKEKEKQNKLKSVSPYARAFQMFKDKKPLADVAIELDIKTDAVLNFYNDFLRLTRMDSLVKIYKELEKDFPIFIHLYRRIKKEGLNNQAITDLLQNHNELIHLNEQVGFYNNHIREQQLKLQQLAQTINKLQSKIDDNNTTSPV